MHASRRKDSSTRINFETAVTDIRAKAFTAVIRLRQGYGAINRPPRQAEISASSAGDFFDAPGELPTDFGKCRPKKDRGRVHPAECRARRRSDMVDKDCGQSHMFQFWRQMDNLQAAAEPFAARPPLQWRLRLTRQWQRRQLHRSLRRAFYQ
jgi:hypothetical protein